MKSAALFASFLADHAEWIRCVDDFFSSSFDVLRKVFAVILAFCELSNPFRTRNYSKEKFSEDLLRRSTRSLGNGEDLGIDFIAETHVLREIQNPLQ